MLMGAILSHWRPKAFKGGEAGDADPIADPVPAKDAHQIQSDPKWLRQPIARCPLIAFSTGEHLTQGAVPASYRGDPRAARPRWIVAHVLVVPAFELSYPVLLVVLVEADDALLHSSMKQPYGKLCPDHCESDSNGEYEGYTPTSTFHMPVRDDCGRARIKKQNPGNEKVSGAPRNFGGDLHRDCWYEEE